jgi:hypothetical protein
MDLEALERLIPALTWAHVNILEIVMTEQTVTRSIELLAEPARVFALLIDASRAPEWARFCRKLCRPAAVA